LQQEAINAASAESRPGGRDKIGGTAMYEMDESIKSIVERTKKTLNICAAELCNQQTEEAAVKTEKVARALISVINVCERIQGLEQGGRQNPYLADINA